jgi:hypothetical protein
MTKDEHIVITKYDLLYEQRMSRVESAIENINENLSDLKSENKEIRKQMSTDFRWLLVLMISLLGVMAKGFHWFT